MHFSKEKISSFIQSCVADSNCEVLETNYGFTSYLNDATLKNHLAYCVYGRVRDTSKSPSTVHTVVLGHALVDAEEVFYLMCKDSFFEQALSKDEAEKRAKESLEDSGLSNAQLSQVMATHGLYPPSGDCNFTLQIRRRESLCVHVQTFLAPFAQSVDTLLEELSSKYNSIFERAVDAEDAYSLPLEELAFRVPVLYMGERGASKTVTAREFARQNKYYCVEMAGNEGIEASDLKGFNVMFNGSAAFMDGEVTEAFRVAQTEKVVLILDELLRVPVRQLSILLTALSPDNGVYRLRTGRILEVKDGLARQEVLECPVGNLCVIATTNLGAEYAVDECDPALAERFMLIMKNTTTSGLRKILLSYAKTRGFSEAIVSSVIKFYEKMKEAVGRGVLPKGVTTRTAIRGLFLAKDEGSVSQCMRAQALQWVSFDSNGAPIPEHLTAIDTFINESFN